MKPLLLKPIPDETIWGCDRISHHRGLHKKYGTWWEVSAHPYCTNEITNLDQKITLQELIDQDPEKILGKGYTLHEMLRLAYLDTQDALSIQVHPEDDYALKHANDYGKYESWYILDAANGASLVAGTNTSDAQTIKEALENNTLENYLQKWPVHKGDYITIPAGMLHALGKDILALEVGTNSNTTYRFYDYGRVDANGNTRPLHLKESFDVTDFSKQPTFVKASHTTRRIGDTPVFTVDEIYAQEDVIIHNDQHYVILSNIDEDCLIQYENDTFTLPKYDSLFVPCDTKITIKQGAHVLFSQPRKEIKK